MSSISSLLWQNIDDIYRQAQDFQLDIFPLGTRSFVLFGWFQYGFHLRPLLNTNWSLWIIYMVELCLESDQWLLTIF